MKIGILTQPLHHNYGGLLQAFALQKYLKNMEHDVLTIDVPFVKPKFWGIRGKTINLYRRIFLGLPKRSEYTDEFKNKNIKTTSLTLTNSEFKRLNKYKFDAYIVGSDQVWRPQYSPNIGAYFLDFLADTDTALRISYAASFGVDHCQEFYEDILNDSSKNLKKFDAVSVREDSGVDICRKYFGVESEQLVDPTLLLDKADYVELINKDKIRSSNGNMMVYVLDRSDDKLEMINYIEQTKGLKQYTVMLNEGKVYPRVTEWLRGFMDAEYVVTDSFHGVVFSIIFNKPFIAIGNSNRGLARFISILNTFDLKERLITSPDELTDDLIFSDIDYTAVNHKVNQERAKSREFFNKALLS
ncbi:polysaccharide pyruvyl transferase family protein [Vibrio fluvialis]|nr:polysaccharide pyruvyl transferase family protein [Vibrio fluvialis]